MNLWIALGVLSLLALAFGISQFVGKKNLMQRTLGSQLKLPHVAWRRLNMLWTINFAVVGTLNLYVAYYYAEETWVSYKLYSAIGFTVLLTILTAIFIGPHRNETEETA